MAKAHSQIGVEHRRGLVATKTAQHGCRWGCQKAPDKHVVGGCGDVRKHDPSRQIRPGECFDGLATHGDEGAAACLLGRGLRLADGRRVQVDGKDRLADQTRPGLCQKAGATSDIDRRRGAEHVECRKAHGRGGVICRSKAIACGLNELAYAGGRGCVVIGSSVPAGDQRRGAVGPDGVRLGVNDRQWTGAKRLGDIITCQPRCADESLRDPRDWL